MPVDYKVIPPNELPFSPKRRSSLFHPSSSVNPDTLIPSHIPSFLCDRDCVKFWNRNHVVTNTACTAVVLLEDGA